MRPFAPRGSQTGSPQVVIQAHNDTGLAGCLFSLIDLLKRNAIHGSREPPRYARPGTVLRCRPRVGRSGGVQGGGGSAELANLEGVDVLLEGNSLATVHGPHVDHLHNGRFSGTLVLPPVAPERHDCLTVGDELLGHHGEVIADFPEPHEHSFEHRLGTDVRASEWKSVGLGPLDVVGHGTEGGGNVARREARIGVFDDFLVGGHLVSSFLSGTVTCFLSGTVTCFLSGTVT